MRRLARSSHFGQHNRPRLGPQEAAQTQKSGTDACSQGCRQGSVHRTMCEKDKGVACCIGAPRTEASVFWMNQLKKTLRSRKDPSAEARPST